MNAQWRNTNRSIIHSCPFFPFPPSPSLPLQRGGSSCTQVISVCSDGCSPLIGQLNSYADVKIAGCVCQKATPFTDVTVTSPPQTTVWVESLWFPSFYCGFLGETCLFRFMSPSSTQCCLALKSGEGWQICLLAKLFMNFNEICRKYWLNEHPHLVSCWSRHISRWLLQPNDLKNKKLPDSVSFTDINLKFHSSECEGLKIAPHLHQLFKVKSVCLLAKYLINHYWNSKEIVTGWTSAFDYLLEKKQLKIATNANLF